MRNFFAWVALLKSLDTKQKHLVHLGAWAETQYNGKDFYNLLLRTLLSGAPLHLLLAKTWLFLLHCHMHRSTRWHFVEPHDLVNLNVLTSQTITAQSHNSPWPHSSYEEILKNIKLALRKRIFRWGVRLMELPKKKSPFTSMLLNTNLSVAFWTAVISVVSLACTKCYVSSVYWCSWSQGLIINDVRSSRWGCALRFWYIFLDIRGLWCPEYLRWFCTEEYLLVLRRHQRIWSIRLISRWCKRWNSSDSDNILLAASNMKMTATEAATAAAADAKKPSWMSTWQQYLRWSPTSKQEALTSEQRLFSLLKYGPVSLYCTFVWIHNKKWYNCNSSIDCAFHHGPDAMI